MSEIMSFDEAQKMFELYWNRARELDCVSDKVAWALFQTLIESVQNKESLREAVYHGALPCITRMEKNSDEQKWDSGCWIRYKMFERVFEKQPSAQPLVLTCDGCRHVGTYDTDFPCSGCIRREKDYYEQSAI